ncbi:MAG: TerC family protein [Bacteroidales bacterium]
MDLGLGLDTLGTPAHWAAFFALVVALLFIDLGVFQRQPHALSWREALAWSGVWIGLAVLFNVVIWAAFGPQRALEFLTGYLIEKALSVDNLFVFLVIFGYFGVGPELQHRVLFWGILGALVMRAVFILAGSVLFLHVHWIIYLFGALLVLTGVKLLRGQEAGFDPTRSRAVRLLTRRLPVSTARHDGRFLVRRGGRVLVTPLLLALMTIEMADVMFAVDSIPAVLAVTRDPFIVFTSNIFAILGLRALYFLVATGLKRLRYLNIALAAILMFVGAKMLLSSLIAIPIAVSLAVVGVLLAASVVASVPPAGRERGVACVEPPVASGTKPAENVG